MGGDALVAELDDGRLLGRGRQERDRGRAFGQCPDLCCGERLHGDDHVGALERVRIHGRAGLGVLLVGDQGV